MVATTDDILEHLGTKTTEQQSAEATSSGSPAVDNKEERRSALLHNYPFGSVESLVIQLNQFFLETASGDTAISLAAEKASISATAKEPVLSSQSPELRIIQREELKNVLLSVINKINRKDPLSLLQAMPVVACREPAILKALNEQLLKEMGDSVQDFNELFELISANLQKPAIAPVDSHSKNATSANDRMKTVLALANQLDDIHAADIRLTAHMVHALMVSFVNISQAEVSKVYKPHKAKLWATLRCLSKRLASVKAVNDEEAFLLQEIHHAIKLSKHVLENTSDHDTTARRYAHRLQIAAELFLLAGEAGVAIAGTVTTGSAAVPAAASSLYRLVKGVFSRVRRVVTHYQADKSYFKAVEVWEAGWLKIAESDIVEAEKGQAQALYIEETLLAKDADEKNQYAHHPQFVRSIVQRLSAIHPTCTQLVQEKLVGAIINYYKLANAKEYLALRRHVAQIIVGLSQKELKLQGVVEFMLVSDDKTILDTCKLPNSDEDKIATALKDTLWGNVALNAWSEHFANDINLYKSQLDPNTDQAVRNEWVQAVRTALPTEKRLSSWGKALLPLIETAPPKDDDLMIIENGATLKAGANIVNSFNVALRNVPTSRFDDALSHGTSVRQQAGDAAAKVVAEAKGPRGKVVVKKGGVADYQSKLEKVGSLDIDFANEPATPPSPSQKKK